MNKHPSNYEHHAALLKALGHPVRLCIVSGLMSGERNVSTMVECTDIAQPTISQHLNVLKAAGIVEGVRGGNQIVYSVVSKEVKKILQVLK